MALAGRLSVTTRVGPGACAVGILIALLPGLASCAWTESERCRVADAPDRTGAAEVLLFEEGPGERLRAWAWLPVELPGETECLVRVEGVRVLYRWNLGLKLASLPLGIFCLVLTPLVVVLEPVIPSPSEMGSFGAPLVTLEAGVLLLGAFCWFPQATPVDGLARNRTEEELPARTVTVVLPAGRWALPLASCAVAVRTGSGTLLTEGVTDEEGLADLPLPRTSPSLAGRVFVVEVTLPDGSPERRMATVLTAPDVRGRLPDPLVVDEDGRVAPGRWWFLPADVQADPMAPASPAPSGR
jgi:hypothetical protein